MGKTLTAAEVNLALKKIRTKYDQLIRDFKKSSVLMDAFEERYLNTLRRKSDLSIFLFAEIEAVEELIKKETNKKLEEKTTKIEPPVEKKESFADKIFDENRQKIEKYPKIDLGSDADEEIERLLGAVRVLINDYFPALNFIYKERRHTTEGDRVNGFYHKLLSQYDYKDEFPISKHYFVSLTHQPKDFKKIDYEHRYIMQETAFLLNDILDLLDTIIKKNAIPTADTKIILPPKKTHSFFHDTFNGLTFEQSIKKVYEFLNDILNDFRFKGIKRNYRI